MKEFISTENDVIESLIREIPIEIERSNIKQDIVNMEARTETILFNIEYLNKSNDTEIAVRKAIIHSAKTGFQQDRNEVDFFKACISNKMSENSKIMIELLG